jgi:hypothetical protein
VGTTKVTVLEEAKKKMSWSGLMVPGTKGVLPEQIQKRLGIEQGQS